MNKPRPELHTHFESNLPNPAGLDATLAQVIADSTAVRTFYRIPTEDDPRTRVVMESLQLSDEDAKNIALRGLDAQQ